VGSGNEFSVCATSNKWQSPSGNIVCEYFQHGDSWVTCETLNDRHQATVSVYGGRGFFVHNGRDLVATPWTPVLPYGAHYVASVGINCWSRVDGMTCRTKYGHGFFMSRRKQLVW
jgi:hypothetical protein